MSRNFIHARNISSEGGPRAALPFIFESSQTIRSVLDVGCGTGPWLRALAESGTTDLMGIDNTSFSAGQLLIDPSLIIVQDLREKWHLGRRFDAVICLEVAEHLEEVHSSVLINSIVKHSDLVVFSAACPGQPGQGHLNCQWPSYWQKLFNENGFACDDQVRWRIWDDKRIEPWYRQNMFIAQRNSRAGQENVLLPVIHPDVHKFISDDIKSQSLAQYRRERMLIKTHLFSCIRLICFKAWHKVKARNKR